MNLPHVPVRKRGNRLRGFLIFAIVLGAVVAVVAWKWVAPVPAGFDPGVTLAQASARAAADQKPVVAVVTADYCLQCQIYKRTALTDDRVVQWVTDNAETAYVKWGTESEDLERLGVSGFPATIVLPTVGEPRVHVGMMSADELLAFLKASEPAPTN